MKRNPLAKKITIVIAGNDEGDLESAFDEAVRVLREGYVQGHNRNDTGAYYFTTTEEVPRGELPA